MTKSILLGAALLATAFASPALAQAVVEDPGYCAQFYPNANCQNYGPGTPLYPGYGGYRSYGWSPTYATPMHAAPTYGWHRYHRRHHYR
jgi:hypothetical protein